MQRGGWVYTPVDAACRPDVPVGCKIVWLLKSPHPHPPTPTPPPTLTALTPILSVLDTHVSVQMLIGVRGQAGQGVQQVLD